MSIKNFDINNVDEGIREAVLFLRSKGFNTIESCQGCGYDDRPHPHQAWVALDKDDEKTEEETRERMEKELLHEGYKSFFTYVSHSVVRGIVSPRKTINVVFGMAIDANIHNTNQRWDEFPWEHLGLPEGYELMRIVPVVNAKEIYDEWKQQGHFDYVQKYKEYLLLNKASNRNLG